MNNNLIKPCDSCFNKKHCEVYKLLKNANSTDIWSISDQMFQISFITIIHADKNNFEVECSKFKKEKEKK
jgi:hypothetical protein